jgi:hypothetical protein
MPPTVEVVCSDGDQCALASEVLVQLVLQRNERVVSCLCEVDAAENDARAQLSDLRSLLGQDTAATLSSLPNIPRA